MNDIQTALQAIVNSSQGQGMDISEALLTLDRFAEDENNAQIEPKLRHYLQRRSYQKALDHLLHQSDCSSH